MSNQGLSRAQANLKLALLNAEAESVKTSEIYAQLQELELPEEIFNRLYELITFTKKTGDKVFAIGKIVLLKILEFVKAHPFLVVGSGIGFVIGSAIATLITSIPILGQILAPLAAALGLTVTAIGAVVGHKLDKQFEGIGKDIAEIVQHFFSLLVNLINTVFSNTATA